MSQERKDYARIEKAILFMRQSFKDQPSLADVAAHVALSPSQVQRLFTRYAGVSPKRFGQYLRLDYAKSILRRRDVSLLEVSYETGLSGTGRLHDLFVTLEAMTPGEYKAQAQGLEIVFSFAMTRFGPVAIGSTKRGLCYLAFEADTDAAIVDMRQRFPKADLRSGQDSHHRKALQWLVADQKPHAATNLHLVGTPFQLKIWEALLKIPSGDLATYGQLAETVGVAGGARAVGNAVGQNPIAFIIPCHRVIRASGALGGYRWGEATKSAILGWEAAREDSD